MSATDTCIHNIEAELDELFAGAGALTPDDLWRVLVLLARAAQHPALPLEVEAAIDRVVQGGLPSRALVEARRPSAVELLDALDSALLSAEDPAGPLADALLEIDDLLSVLELEERRGEAETLADQAVALVDLAPQGAAALDAWATRRLATVSEHAAVGRLWSAVAVAGASTVLASLPALDPRPMDVHDILDRAAGHLAEVIPLWASTPTISRAWRAAAADFEAAWSPAEGEDWTTYDDDGTTVAQVQVRAGEKAPQTATLVVQVADRRWTSIVRADRVGVSGAWFRLGSEKELATIFERAREELGVGLDSEPEVWIEWERDGAR